MALSRENNAPQHLVDRDAVVEFSAIRAEATAALTKACETHLDGKTYDVRYQTRWTDAITQSAIDGLHALGPNFKFAVNCLLVQKRDTNRLFSESAAYLDPATDGLCSVKWESPSVTCVLSAFAAAL